MRTEKVYFLTIVALLFWSPSIGQVGQINIDRVQLMHNLPSPYDMRNWKDVAVRYDSLVYAAGATGQYLPIIRLKGNGVNYPSLQPILMDSYVGSASAGSQAESINIIPSIVGASLMGIDKSNQNGVNWVLKAKDFFNQANGQNVYLNGYSSSSGSDWWYDMMPNVFFYQLYSQYPNTQDFNTQFTTIADRWLAAVQVMGGSTTPWTLPQMNYRGFNLSTQTPNANTPTEPESAGTIGWVLYHAYLKTGDKKYLDGAQMAIGYLNSVTSNPAYEIQLPYGSFVAARMNAELGTTYDIAKMVNWSFDQSSKRNWGTVVGSWGDGSNIDVSGLVGEIDNPNTGYAFAMNGFQQAAALVPLVKYDKRFARAIGKWTLNVANASRLFYSQYLAADHQDDFTWSSTHDPHSAIAYEALKQNINSKNLYATGDAERNGWAQTNLGLYGSSSVGYLAAVVEPTDVDGILLLNLNKTDFFGKNPFPNFLVYNPYGTSKQITLPLGGQTYDIYDAISETVIKTGATGNTPLNVPSDQAMLLVYLPQGSTPIASSGKLYVGTDIVDYHYGYDFAGKLRITSLASVDTLVQYNQSVPIYSSIENAPGAVTYKWYEGGVLIASSSNATFSWTVPSAQGMYTIKLNVVSGADSVQDSLLFHVVPHIPTPPVVTGITADTTFYYMGSQATLKCVATNDGGGPLIYKWTFPTGSVKTMNDSLLVWNAPSMEGLYEISCEVANSDSLKVTAKRLLLVKAHVSGETTPLAFYPLNGDVLDISGNHFDGTLSGAQPTTDAQGQSNGAYHFSSSTDFISVANASALNFTDKITLAFWVKLDGLPQEEYILSHGSYEERWKVSVVPGSKLRWTVKTTTGTMDLDTSFPLQLNQFYHFTVVYTGYSMELYVNGVLDTFLADTGSIQTTSKPITFGRKDFDIANYYLTGTLDEVRIYDAALEPEEIATLQIVSTTEVTSVRDETQSMEVYPNPANGVVYVSGIVQPVNRVELVDVMGRGAEASYTYDANERVMVVELSKGIHGMVILRIDTANGVVYRKVVVQ